MYRQKAYLNCLLVSSRQLYCRILTGLLVDQFFYIDPPKDESTKPSVYRVHKYCLCCSYEHYYALVVYPYVCLCVCVHSIVSMVEVIIVILVLLLSLFSHPTAHVPAYLHNCRSRNKVI